MLYSECQYLRTVLLDNIAASIQNPPVKPVENPYVAVLLHASDRYFLNTVWLVDDLLKDGSGTMYRLSATPEAFGTPRPSLDATARQKRLNLLLTACRAFIIAERKARTHAVHQHNLRLTEHGA